MGTTLNVLTALRHAGAYALVSDLADFFDEQYDQKKLSARLCRMRSQGYCMAEMKDGKNLWTLTQKGQRELEKLQELHQQPDPQSHPELDSEPQPEPQSHPELDSEPQPEPQSHPELDSEPQPEPQSHPELDSEPQPEPQSHPELDSEPQPDPQPDQQSDPESASEHEYDPDSIARELLEAMELELALDDVKWRLQAARIPARTARVYREIVEMLPPIVRDALNPITALIESAH